MPYHLTWSSFTCPEENSRRCMASDRPWFTLPLSPTLIFFCISPLFSPFRTLIFPIVCEGVAQKKWEFLQTSWRPVKITIPLLRLWVGKLELTMLFWQRAFPSVCNYTAYAIKFFLQKFKTFLITKFKHDNLFGNNRKVKPVVCLAFSPLIYFNFLHE